MSTPPRIIRGPPNVRKRKPGKNVDNIISNLKNSTPLLNEFKSKLNNDRISLISNRNSASPYNRIYISNNNDNNSNGKKVYKIGLKKPLTNEYLSYSLLNKKYPDDVNIHYPKMYGCERINDSSFVLLVIQFQENIKPIHYNGNLIKFHKNNNVKKIIEYLEKAGIVHQDGHGNFFYYFNNKNEKTFFVIDFEEVTFIRNNSKVNHITINKLHPNIKNKSNNLNPNNSYFKNNHSPEKKKRSTLFGSLFNN